MSALVCTTVAPSYIRMLYPSDLGLSGEPGIAMTSPLRSKASRAVISDPELEAVSTNTTSIARLAMIRLRTGKCHTVGCVPGGHFRKQKCFFFDHLL